LLYREGFLIMTETKERQIHNVFTTVAPYLDTFTRGFSMGMDNYWRKRGVALSGIKRGNRVLDICAGTGELSFILARKVGKEGAVVATDFCEDMLVLARKKNKDRFTNIEFLLADAKQVPFPDKSFDAVTVAYGIRNIPDTESALREVLRVLKPGGTFLCVELTRPRTRWFLAFYKWYTFKIMPFISYLVMRNSAPFQYLPRSIEEFYDPAAFHDVLLKNGFSDVLVKSMTMRIATVYCARKTNR
jgi:demethylmenaquinone methyltransferase / 2-methoxy-6-polyprenyl-1,4-benzoquinol methylase